MINTHQDIAALFNIFHDGVIDAWKMRGDKLTLRIQIQYLAERIKAGFTIFDVELYDVADLQFDPWLADLSAERKAVYDLETIFGGQPDILSGRVARGLVEVTCNQGDLAWDFCGGVLAFCASRATVCDEQGTHYCIDEMKACSKGYWDEFSSRNKVPW